MCLLMTWLTLSCHYLCPFGCYHCADPCYCWVGHLPSYGSSGFHFSNHGSQCCWKWVLWCCPWGSKDPTGLQITLGHHCHPGYGGTYWARQVDYVPCMENTEFLVSAITGCWSFHMSYGEAGTYKGDHRRILADFGRWIWPSPRTGLLYVGTHWKKLW